MWSLIAEAVASLKVLCWTKNAVLDSCYIQQEFDVIHWTCIGRWGVLSCHLCADEGTELEGFVIWVCVENAVECKIVSWEL
jgi:hypothetical protein